MKKSWAKRDSIKNYFPLPNEIYHLGLSHGAIAVYGYLLSIEDRSTYQCYPSYATIGHAVGMSRNTVRKYVAELEERRLIRTEQTTITTADGRKRNGSLLYTILPVQLAIEQFYERQLNAAERERQRQRAAKALEKRGGGVQ
ncbi:MAG: helix-turn-helix domain-containing protein [Candidatus Limivicinus sp.]|nr:helix-turn-helix domain-containing protein [Candidatus Limivicinus sp.]